MKRNTPEHLWSKVAIGAEDDCWPWAGKVNNSGYGSFSCGGELRGAHVWAFWLRHRKFPAGGCALHSCDNRRCCNPGHIFEGTKSDNSKDAWTKGRNFYQKNPSARPRGQDHANAVLTNAQAQEIRDLYATGLYRQKDIGKKFGVSQRTISLIVRKEAYL